MWQFRKNGVEQNRHARNSSVGITFPFWSPIKLTSNSNGKRKENWFNDHDRMNQNEIEQEKHIAIDSALKSGTILYTHPLLIYFICICNVVYTKHV